MKQKLQRLKGGRLGSQLFLKTFMLLAFMLSGVGSAWAQETISKKELFASATLTPVNGDDAYDLGSNGKVHYYAQGLKDGNGNFMTTTVGGKYFFKLNNNDIEVAHIKLQFNTGDVKAGDIITITCASVYNLNQNKTVGYKVGVSNTYESGAFNSEPLSLSHTVTANEIVTDGDKQYIRIYRGDMETGYNTITVTRTASFNYSVVAKHDGATLKTIASGSSETDVTVAYPRYILDGTTLYGIAHNASGDYWRTTVSSAAPTKELNYSETVSNVVFYTEGEEIAGFNGANNLTRASNGHMGYTSNSNADTYKNATTLNIGKYKIVARGVNGNAATRTCNFKVGSNVVYAFSIPNGTDINGTSTEFEVNSNNTQLSVACEGSSASGLDYFYIIKTGDLTPEVTLTSAASQTINASQTLSLGVNTKNVSFTTLELYSDAAHTNKLGFVGYNNPYTFNPAEGVKKGDDPNKGTNLKSGEGTYYFVFTGINSNGSNGWIETKVSYTVEVTAPGVTYELNGGQCDRMTDPLNQEVTLPRPTKAGHTFIGWMNAAGDITPTAGKAGETKTFNEAKTLYALWYKNNCEIDFTANGPLTGTPNKSGAAISETGLFIAGGTPVGNITINNTAIDSRFGIQTGTNWMYYNGGLYQFNTGNRSFGVKGCEGGDYITVVSSTNPNVNADDAELVSSEGNTYVYKVKKEGNVKFTPAKYTNIYSITVASPCPHTIWTNGNVADADHKATWWNNFSPFYKIEKGHSLNYKFTIHGGENSARNWAIIVQSIPKHNGDLGITGMAAERVIARADGNVWGSGVSENNNGAYNGPRLSGATVTFKKNGADMPWTGWSDGLDARDNGVFTNDMKEAVVDMTVEYGNDKVLKITATTVKNGNTYVLSITTVPLTEDVLYMALEADQSWIEGITHPIKFAETTPHTAITAAGTATYTQPALGAPEGTWVKYEVVEGADKTTVESASISQIDGSSEYTLNIKGKGKVTVRATCGGNTAEYVLDVDGLMFANPSPYEKHGTTSYDMVLDEAVSGVTFELVKYDTTPCLRNVTLTKNDDNKTCHITNIPNGADDGGIIVVRATKNNSDGTKTIADCCLTIAYDLHVWNMYSDPLVYGSLVEGNAGDVITGDPDLMNEKSRVGSAHYVIYDSSKSYTYVKPGDEDDPDAVDQAMTNNNRVEYNNWMDGQDYYRKENWFNAQNGIQTCNADGGEKDYDLLHRHWKFTYKTCSYDNGVRTYVNEPLFAYKNTVIGDNGRIIKQTAGLRFNAPSLKFGVSDNDTKNSEGGSVAIREQDRCVLLQVGSRLCIPRVQEGRYIRIHWYRHSDNNGDRVRITNGEDLDGRAINPEDVIRFTGSHYYNDHKGSFVFKVKKSDSALPQNYETADGKTYCDVFIDPYGIGWIEFYRIEIMDKFESELQLAEVDVADKITADQIRGKRTQADIGKPQATIDNWNSHDLNNVDSYNRTVFDAEKANHPVLASRLTSRIQTHAKGAGLVEYAPELYISGYAGHCFTWNGWLQTTLQVRRLDNKGTAECDGWNTHNDEYNMDNVVPAEPVWVGNNLKYTMHPLKHVKGEGNLVLTLRTHSGWPGEAHYTFDKREAIVAVGEYSVQDYPYTWDFTDYNFGLENAYYPIDANFGKTYTAMDKDNINVKKQYGYWEKDESDATIKKMGTYQTKISESFGTGAGSHKLYDESKRTNLPKFAQGSQLSLGTDGEKHTILETEGLRINIPAVDGANASSVKLVQKSTNNGYVDDGYLVVNGTVTIPEVDKDMYIFIKGTRPASASNTTASDTQFAPNVVKYNADADVTCYQATGGADGTKADVVLTFNGPATLYKIGVTNQKKAISYFGWSTESRAVNIDYNETRYFSANVESFYVHDATNWDHRSDNFNLDTDLEVRLQGTSAGVDDRLYIPQGTGIVMHDKDCTYDSKTLEDSGAGTSYVVPLFVNACNVPQTNTENYQNNILEASTNKDKETTTIYTSLESDNIQYYTMSNYYVGAKLADNAWSTGKFYTTTPRFYRYIGAGGSSSSATLKNMSFLKVEKSAGVKIMNDIISVDFGYGVDTDPTAIEIVGWDGSEINNGIYYNLRGQAINGKPVVPGIYIKNGKKYYVK